MTRHFRGFRVGVLAIAGAIAALGATVPAPTQNPARRPVRVVLGSVAREIPITQPAWRLLDTRAREVAKGDTSGRWSILRDGRRVRVLQSDAPVSGWIEGTLTLEAADGGEVVWQRKTYRGALTFAATDTALLVVNRVDVEEYLRSVVPLEIGGRLTSDHAAVEAQAVAARSFTYTKMLASGNREFDVRATDADQVYAGTSAETFWGDLAVAATAGWVLSYRGQVVTAPYHSSCGGTTATPSETWRGGRDGYLRSVSDTSSRTGRPWCDLSPRVAWERRLSVTDLAGSLARYGPTYTTIPGGAAASINDVRIDGLTASGRARTLVFATGSGDVTIRGNDVRYVLRVPGGNILPTTSFSVTAERSADEQLTGIVVRGRGNGHGVGMCQWGAIARARAGDDFRTILKAYYPGAELRRAP